jgi:hypothetical protein
LSRAKVWGRLFYPYWGNLYYSATSNLNRQEEGRVSSKGLLFICQKSYFTEVFDSSKYDSMAKMEKSADIKEGEHLKEILTSVEKEKPIDPTTTKVSKISEMDINSPPPRATTVPNASPPRT